MTIFEIIIILIWWLVSILILLALLIAGIANYLKTREPAKILPRFFIAFAVYIFVAVVSAVSMGGMMDAGIRTQPEHKFLEIKGKTFFVLLLMAYGFIGWLLCSFVLGNLPFLRKVFNSASKSPQSLFETK